ncbi:MAG: peptidase domain-containing ABC transporter [Clostridium sp.]|nr:peptidase domain-containing ABC transporter [Clostridium sp.]
MRYYCIRQHDISDCGAACLATILKQYGRRLPITRIREIAGTDRQGTNAYGMVKAAGELGFTAKAVKGGRNSVFSGFPLPAVAHVLADGSRPHYIVIHKITQKRIMVADPGKGLVKYTPEEFLQIWTGILILMVPAQTFTKSDGGSSMLPHFFALLKPQKRLIADIFIASLLLAGMGILGAFYFKAILDDILPASAVKTLTVISIGVILLKIFSVLLQAVRTQLLVYMSQNLDIALLLGYYNHVLKLPMNFFGSRKVGEIISRFQDAGSVRDAISRATLSAFIDILMAVIGGIILFFQQKKLFFISVVIVVCYAILVFAFNRSYKKLNQAQMQNNAELTSYLVESLNGIETVKAFNGETAVNIETEFRFIRLLRSVLKLGSVSNIQEMLKSFVEGVGGVVIIWMGAYMVINGDLTFGTLLTFHSLLAYFLTPIKNIIDLQSAMQTAIVAAERLGEILDIPPEISEKESRKMTPKNLKGDIVFNEIYFRYGTRQAVLENFSLHIKSGESVALVGESGAGKSTLAKLLLNFYQSEKGNLTIGGYAVNDIQFDVLRSKIAYIPQDVFLFSGTVYENIVFGMPDADLEMAIECAKMAMVHDDIINMPLRYESYVDENGSNLSGGQRQRIAIAHALMKHPDILIMDEATSNLDAVSEKSIHETIDKFSKEITTIIIAHRLSTIRRCDRIFVLSKGKIIESGSHSDLMNLQGEYYHLYRSQEPETISVGGNINAGN